MNRKYEHRELRPPETQRIGTHMLGGRDSFVVKKINIYGFGL